MIDHENLTNTLGDHFRNVHNPNITLTKGISNGDEIVIVLRYSIERWR